MPHRSYRKESRDVDFGTSDTGVLSRDQMNCGSLLRIADGIEKMAGNYAALLYEAKSQKERADGLTRTVGRLRDQLRGYRSYIKGLRKVKKSNKGKKEE